MKPGYEQQFLLQQENNSGKWVLVAARSGRDELMKLIRVQLLANQDMAN